MGSPSAEEGHEEIESPQHRVVIARGFHISCTPVTRNQWAAVTGLSPSTAAEATHPVTEVSWNDAVAFCAWASQATGRKVYRPTEAQWE